MKKRMNIIITVSAMFILIFCSLISVNADDSIGEQVEEVSINSSYRNLGYVIDERKYKLTATETGICCIVASSAYDGVVYESIVSIEAYTDELCKNLITRDTRDITDEVSVYERNKPTAIFFNLHEGESVYIKVVKSGTNYGDAMAFIIPDSDNASVITDADLDEGVRLDRTYKIIPTENIDVLGNDGGLPVYTVLVKEEKGNWSSVPQVGVIEANTAIRLKAGKEYCFYNAYNSLSWIRRKKIIELTYDANGGLFEDKSIVSRLYSVGSTSGDFSYKEFIPEPTRKGYDFYDYNTKPNGSGVSINDKGWFTKDSTFYAIWTCTKDKHKYGAWKVKKATELASGHKTRTCTKCGKVEKKTIKHLKPSLPAVTITTPKAQKKAATFKWKKLSKTNQKKVASIQIQYALDKKFKKGVKTVSVKKTASSKKISKLASKKIYYVRIRSYKKDKKGVHVSKWSKIKAVKVK